MVSPTVIPGPSALKGFVGKPLGTSEWVELPQRRINQFADATGDHQWIHTDPERARDESPYGGTIAHGYLTLSLAPGLLPQLLRVEGSSMAVNYGIEKLRFPSALPAGGRVRLSAEIAMVRDLPGGAARTTISLAFEAEGQAKPACVADVIYVYFP